MYNGNTFKSVTPGIRERTLPLPESQLSVYEYILDLNLVNLTNYKLNICEKKGNGTLIWAVSLHFERFVYVCGLSNENHLSKLNCVPIGRRYLKRIKAYFLHVLSVTGDLAEWSVAPPLDLRQWVRYRQGTFLRGLGAGLSLPRRLVSLSDWIWQNVFLLSL